MNERTVGKVREREKDGICLWEPRAIWKLLRRFLSGGRAGVRAVGAIFKNDVRKILGFCV